MATLSPTGWTPIGPALLKAADDLDGGSGSKRIVLISDGEDTCAPLDPCEVAREIAAKGIGLTIDTLGLVPNTKMRQQLSCIAEATGGTYTSVEHTDELTDKVNQLVDRAADPVVTPVATEGADSCAEAPTLKSGLYTDREEFGQERWYRVDVEPGQELRASVSVSSDRAMNPTTACCCGRSPCTAGRSCAARRRASAVRTSSRPVCAIRRRRATTTRRRPRRSASRSPTPTRPRPV